VALVGAALLAVMAGVLLAVRGGEEGPLPDVPLEVLDSRGTDPFAYTPTRSEALERRAAAGLSHVLYTKSPGGAVASARRTARFRPLVERVGARSGLDPDLLEAIVFLESAGRADAAADPQLEGAVGLTQILAGTGQGLLAMRVDLGPSRRLTRRIAQERDHGTGPGMSYHLELTDRSIGESNTIDVERDDAPSVRAPGFYPPDLRVRMFFARRAHYFAGATEMLPTPTDVSPSLICPVSPTITVCSSSG